jgi:hypothetical protein
LEGYEMSCSICGDKDWYCKGCIISTYSGINRAESEISRLKAENEKLKGALELVCHSVAGTVGTKTNSELPEWFRLRLQEANEVLNALSEGEEKK